MKRVLLLFMIILTMSCSTDDVQDTSFNNQSYTLVYETQELGESITVYAGSEITYTVGFEFIESDYDSDTNKVIVETQPGPTKIESNFYIENGSEVSIILFDSGGNIVDEQTISQVNYNYIYEF